MREYEIKLECGTVVVLESEWESEEVLKSDARGNMTIPTGEMRHTCAKEGRTWIMIQGLRVLVDDKTFGTEEGKQFGRMIQEAELKLVQSL